MAKIFFALSALLLNVQHAALPFFVDKGTSQAIVDELIKYDEETLNEISSLKIKSRAFRIETLAAANKASIIFFADLHGVSEIQKRAGQIFNFLSTANSKPKIFIAEFVYAKYQNHLDDFMKGKLTADELHKLIKFDGTFAPEWWPPYADLLELLKSRKARVVAAFKGDENTNWADLRPRDAFVVDLVKEELKKNPNAQVFLLHGQSHLIGKTHIQDTLAEAYPKKTVKFLTAVSAIHWRALQKSLVVDEGLYLRLKGAGSNTFYTHTISPVERDTYTVAGIISFAADNYKDQLTKQYMAIRANYSEAEKFLAAGDSKAAEKSMASLKIKFAEWVVLLLKPGVIANEAVYKAVTPPLIALAQFVQE